MDASLPGDACSFLSTNSATECPRRRPCRECLLEPGCMIDTTGACVSSVTAASEQSFHQAFARNVTLPAARLNNSLALGEQQNWEFPAFDATYCPRDDTVCATCIQEAFWYTSGDSRFCVGASGCVCIHHCEIFPLQGPPCLSIPTVTPTTSPPVMASTPTPTSVPARTKPSKLETESTEWYAREMQRFYITVAVIAVVLLLLCCGCCWFCKTVRSRRRASVDVASATQEHRNGSSHSERDKTSRSYREMQP